MKIRAESRAGLRWGVTEASARAVVLLSGGLDSAVALAVARAEGRACTALCIDYGQRHRVEIECARRVASQLGAPEFRLVAIDLRAVGGSALTASIDVPKGKPKGGIPITYVPARNLAFLSIAAGLAEAVGASEIYLGVNAVDYSGYPDCRREFLDAFEACARLGTKAGLEGRGVRVRSPLCELSKAAIIRRGTELGVDFSLTSSCYDPALSRDGLPVACGACESCRIRRRGFAEARTPDPTRYAQAP